MRSLANVIYNEVVNLHFWGFLDRENNTPQGDRIILNPNTEAQDAYIVLRGRASRYAYGRLKDWQAAEDAVQDAYLRMLVTREGVDSSNFAQYFKINLDQAISVIRTQDANHGAVITSDFVVDEETGETAVDLFEYGIMPDQMYEIQEKMNIIMNLSNKMRPRTKHLIRRIFIFGYSPSEVAGMMDMEIDAVHKAISRFNKKLERIL